MTAVPSLIDPPVQHVGTVSPMQAMSWGAFRLCRVAAEDTAAKAVMMKALLKCIVVWESGQFAV